MRADRADRTPRPPRAPRAPTAIGVLLLLVLLSWLVRPPPARGQAPRATPPASQPMSPEEARRRAKELFQLAETEYRLGRFAQALDDYQAALKLRHHPSIIFNIAQCYRHLKNLERAVFFYKLFLADWERVYPGTKPSNEAEVQGHVNTLEAALRVAEQRARTPSVTASTGDLVLKGVPAGAQVFVDGVLRGVGPILAPLGLPPGRRIVRVELGGHEAWSAPVAVALARTVTAQVELRKLVNVAIDSRPVGAMVSVDGEERGWTPVRVTLAAQRPHTVALRKDGYQPLEQAMTLEPRDTAWASYALEPTRDVFGARNEWFALESGLAFGMGGNEGFVAGGGAINIVTLKWKHASWTIFTIGGGGGSGRWYSHLETRIGYPFRFGRRGQHQLRVGMGFGLLAVSVDDVTRAQREQAWIQQKSSNDEPGNGPFVTLGLTPAVEYIYQSTARTLWGGGFRALVPITHSFSEKDHLGSPAVGLLTARVGWASLL